MNEPRVPWRPHDLMTAVVANATAVVLLLVSGVGAGGRDTLVQQVSMITLAAAGLMVAAAGDALFLLSAKEAVTRRCATIDASLPESPPARPATVSDGRTGADRLAVTADAEACPPPAGSAGWRLHTDRIFAGAAVAAGGATLLAGWAGIARVVDPAHQIPWLLGGGFSGLLLLGVGGTAWLAAALTDQWTTLIRITRSIERLT